MLPEGQTQLQLGLTPARSASTTITVVPTPSTEPKSSESCYCARARPRAAACCCTCCSIITSNRRSTPETAEDSRRADNPDPCHRRRVCSAGCRNCVTKHSRSTLSAHWPCTREHLPLVIGLAIRSVGVSASGSAAYSERLRRESARVQRLSAPHPILLGRLAHAPPSARAGLLELPPASAVLQERTLAAARHRRSR